MVKSRASAAPYGDDLAYIHDVGYDFHANGLAAPLLALLRKSGLGGRPVIDLGCGSGIWAARLTDEGFPAIGVDLSPAMIALAKERAPAAEFHVASFLDFDLPPCGAITALGEPLCYLFDRGNGRQALSRMVRRAFEALDPGGLFVFDIVEIGTDRGRPPSARAGDGWACLARYAYDARRDQLTRHITTFRQSGQLYRRSEETHRVQLYDRREVAAMLRQSGFRVRVVRRFADYQLLPGRVAFVARKPNATR
jgi:SAM-dependent methyltransferase